MDKAVTNKKPKVTLNICVPHELTVMPEPVGPEGPLAPKYLADQLTLVQPEIQISDSAHPLLRTGTPKIFHLPASLILANAS